MALIVEGMTLVFLVTIALNVWTMGTFRRHARIMG
jgi:Na+-transporting methylmalonyl-CoA/oxaloacetate decarboxylase gamma subunit